mmetsp:Transcript_49182/g.115024  ORF Transcript_49182/g.115024 Transcript_49182/m.115024 type:complete len:435 (+) Transcript_49182:42-1346(+)
MTSSSSGTSSSEEAEKDKKGKKKKKKTKKDKKEKKDKAAKKDKKKDKKEAKDGKKAKKKQERAEQWECDRPEAVRLVIQLLEMDPGVFVELGECIFDKLDANQSVNIETLDSKHLKKKLRHLLKALRIGSDNTGFTSPDPKVSFRTLFDLCVKDAQEHMGSKQQKMQAAMDALAAQTASSQATPPARTSADLAPARGPTGPEDEADETKAQKSDDGMQSDADAAPVPEAPKQPKKKGPQLPSPGIFACEEEQEEESEAEENLGPKVEGNEREGVDLRALPAKSGRQEWMMTPGESLAGVFGGGGPRKGDAYQVKRSTEEQKKFEELMAARGPSLAEQNKEGNVDATTAAADFKKRQKEHEIEWGSSKPEKRQRGPGGMAGDGDGFDHGHEAFDPDKDMEVARPMSGVDFSKLVEDSSGRLAGRFHRSHVASSFL